MSDLSAEQYALVLAEAARAPGRVLAPVVKRAAVNVKWEWRSTAKAEAGTHAPAYPYAIDFDDVLASPLSAEVEVGPDKGKRQGALGNLIEFGSVNNPAGLQGQRALDKESESFEKWCAKALGDRL